MCRIMRTRFVSALLALVVACGGGKSKTETTPTGGTTATAPAAGSGPAKTGEDAPLPLWTAVKRGKLPNGLTYYVMNHKKP